MIIMRLLTWIKGIPMGQDEYGNRYFEERFLFSKPDRAPKRWVRYATKEADPSRIPPAWHAWIHFTYEAPLEEVPYPWKKKHLRNLTGTSYAYRPAASGAQGLTQKVKPCYERWAPSDDQKD